MIDKDILKNFSKKEILITGGTGLIGRQIVEILKSIETNIKIVSLDRIKLDYSVEYIFGDLTNFEFCKDITRGIDFVFHLAGIKGSANISEKKLASHFIPTLMMNTNVLEACRINNVKKIVYTSSIGAYPNTEIFKESEYCIDSLPMDFAGWAKRMAELQIYAYKYQYNLDNFAIVRPCNVYGPGDNFDPNNAMVIPSLIYRIFTYQKNKENGIKDPVIIWGDGNAIRDFVYSKDVAEGIILALYYGTNSSFVNLGSGKGYSIKELIETFHNFIDFEYEFDITKSAGFPRRIMDISLAKKLIHYNPDTPLLEGLKETWNWFKENQDEYLKKKNYFKEP